MTPSVKLWKRKTLSGEEHYNYFLNQEFVWDQSGLSISHPIIGLAPLATADMAYDSVEIMKSEKAAGLAGCTCEILITDSEVYEISFWSR